MRVEQHMYLSRAHNTLPSYACAFYGYSHYRIESRGGGGTPSGTDIRYGLLKGLITSRVSTLMTTGLPPTGCAVVLFWQHRAQEEAILTEEHAQGVYMYLYISLGFVITSRTPRACC